MHTANERLATIWPMMIMHAVIDFGGGLRHIAMGGESQIAAPNSTLAGAIGAIIVSLPLLLYGLFILHKAAPFENPGNRVSP